MDSDSFEEAILNFSPVRDSNALPDLSTAFLGTNVILEKKDNSSCAESSEDKDRICHNVNTEEFEEDYNEGSFGDEEEVIVASDQYSWKIDHARGEHKFKVHDFIAATKSASFDGSRAIDMIHRQHTIDYGSRKSGSRAARLDDDYIPSFFLDLLIIIGQPLKSITEQSSRLFDNITISFKNWRAPYSYKHVHGLSFDMEHRTFRVASGATREAWYIVMHPIANTPEELLSRSERQKRRKKSSESSALQHHHAQFLASYIKKIFLIGELLGEGVEPSWRLDGPHSQKIAINKWTMFQEAFMLAWPDYVRHNTQDTFWTENQPAFHAYDYGANIQIEVTEQLRSVPRETRLRSVEESSGSEEESSETEGSMEHEDSYHGSTQGAGPVPEVSYDYEHLFVGGLQQLRTELESKYVLGHIETVSYALAVDINCLDGQSPDQGDKLARCLLANRDLVLREYQRPHDFTFYPLAFHPAYGNFSSPRPPAFLADNVLTVMQENMSYQHNGASVLTCGYFQGYSNIKRSIRHGPDDLLATQGVATAALTLPDRDGNISARVAAKRDRLLQRLKGRLTPDDPKSSKPFFREAQRIENAIAEEQYAYRMEQVLSVQVSRLSDSSRNFSTVLRPIFQLIRLFIDEPQCYTHLFRSFRPSVFPGVLVSFADMFAQAIDSIHRRFEATGGKGLSVALAEGVSALDRLGSYCFTGFPKSLMGSVLKPLGTIESIEEGGWPFINPQMLDLRGAGSLNIGQWPRRENGRPVLMHIASIAFHYGSEVAASCQSETWFNELGGLRVQGPSSAAKFVEELIQEVWRPQTIAFVTRQFRRRMNRGSQIQAASDGQGALQILEDQRERVKLWAQSENPFCWEEYEAVLPIFLSQETVPPSAVLRRTRRDFAEDLYEHCMQTNQAAGKPFRSQNGTWFRVLRAAVRHTVAKTMSKDHWVGAITAAMLTCQIECLPGSYQSRLSYRRMIRLVGYALPVSAMAARPGSLKRAAIEAEHRVKRPSLRNMVVDFGCTIPFDTIPELVEKGFRQQQKLFAEGNQGILEHYQTARQCLAECLGDPVCDLMLILVLTMTSSSVTPTVLPKAHEFSAGAKKDNSAFAANLVTRMLWFFRPNSFPWDADDGVVLRVPEMTKKIEHKGVSNRLLRELRWVQVVHSNRDSPRNSDLVLQNREELLRRRRELMDLRKNAVGFIAAIFRSCDSIWVERCSAIIKGT